MFEKLKEYGLYIIIWLIALWALAYAFLSTRNSQAWADVLWKVQDNLINAISKSQKVKDKSTFVTHAQWLEWLSIGQYKLDLSKVSLLNDEWDTQILDWTLTNLDLPTVADTTTAWKLQIVMATSNKIWSAVAKTYVLEKDKVDTAAIDKNMNEQLRWFLATWYVWFASFKEEADAKSFRDSYFSNWMVVKSKTPATNWYWVFVEISR